MKRGGLVQRQDVPFVMKTRRVPLYSRPRTAREATPASRRKDAATA